MREPVRRQQSGRFFAPGIPANENPKWLRDGRHPRDNAGGEHLPIRAARSDIMDQLDRSARRGCSRCDNLCSDKSEPDCQHVRWHYAGPFQLGQRLHSQDIDVWYYTDSYSTRCAVPQYPGRDNLVDRPTRWRLTSSVASTRTHRITSSWRLGSTCCTILPV